MNDDARREWMITARATLNGIPADLLARGCRVARTYCDHPSKIVPTIVREVETAWANRKRAQSGDDRIEHQREEKPDYVTPAEAAAILKEYGLR